jgi:hypothetical protein
VAERRGLALGEIHAELQRVPGMLPAPVDGSAR